MYAYKNNSRNIISYIFRKTKKRVSCVVPNCRGKSSKSDLKFFKFPKDPIKVQNWIDSIGLLPKEIINKHNYVCQRHFLNEHITCSNHLTRNAVPILNITKRSNNEESSHLSSNFNNFIPDNVSANGQIISASSTSTITRTQSTQTGKIDDEMQFLQLIDKISCSQCESYGKHTYSCVKCRKNVKLIILYKKKIKKIQRNYKMLKLNFNNLKRNFQRLQIKHSKLKNIDDHIDSLNVNDTTKNVCKLLVKDDYYYNESDKIFAQSLFYKSASTYRYLRDELNLKLPSVSSIYKWSPIKFIPAGTNEILMGQLEKIFSNMSQKSKVCVLCFDEIRIKKDLTVNIFLDRVEGFCDDGQQRKNDLATSALFFMLRGLVDEWKYVLSYVLVNSSTNPTYLSELLKQNIRVSKDILKLNVVMVTCDQAATNIATFKMLGVTPENPYFFVDDYRILAQYDPPHLIKSVRNAFINNKIEHSDYGICDINVVRKLFEIDSIQNIKMMPKLTKQHFEPNTFQKMNVKLAVQMMSSTVASAIRTTLKIKPDTFGGFLDNVIPTQHFIQRFNDIFDALNCRHFSTTALYERPLKVNNNIYKLLEDSLLFLDKLRIISKKENYFKFIKGFKTTINAQILLINLLESQFDIEYLLTGRTNQDCLENFFSLLRGKGGFNYMPSSYEIGVHFANVVVRKITLNSPFKNCIQEESHNIDLDWISFKSEFEMSLKNNDSGHISPADEFIEEANLHIIKDNAIIYYAGYCIFKKINCQKCQEKLLKVGDEINISDTFISEKNFNKIESNFGSLTAPSDEFCKIARSLVTVFEKYYHRNCSFPNIIQFLTNESIKLIIQEYDSFLPDPNNMCFDHIRKLIHFFMLVLMRKNCKWSIVNNEFSKAKSCSNTKKNSRKLKILKN